MSCDYTNVSFAAQVDMETCKLHAKYMIKVLFMQLLYVFTQCMEKAMGLFPATSMHWFEVWKGAPPYMHRSFAWSGTLEILDSQTYGAMCAWAAILRLWKEQLKFGSRKHRHWDNRMRFFCWAFNVCLERVVGVGVEIKQKYSLY